MSAAAIGRRKHELRRGGADVMRQDRGAQIVPGNVGPRSGNRCARTLAAP